MKSLFSRIFERGESLPERRLSSCPKSRKYVYMVFFESRKRKDVAMFLEKSGVEVGFRFILEC